MEYILGGIGLLGILTIAGFSIKTNNDVNSKIGRNYQRMDELKREMDCKYVRSDICGVVHEQIRNDLVEIKKDLKSILQNGKNH